MSLLLFVKVLDSARGFCLVQRLYGVIRGLPHVPNYAVNWEWRGGRDTFLSLVRTHPQKAASARLMEFFYRVENKY
jgi:hypothetical protein